MLQNVSLLFLWAVNNTTEAVNYGKNIFTELVPGKKRKLDVKDIIWLKILRS